MNAAEREAWIEQLKPAIAEFCRRWHITEFALFGSILRDDFGPDSDIDVLVTFAPDHHWGVLSHIRMEDELSTMLGREVEIVSRMAVEQDHLTARRKAILDSARTLNVA